MKTNRKAEPQLHHRRAADLRVRTTQKAQLPAWQRDLNALPAQHLLVAEIKSGKQHVFGPGGGYT